MRVVLDTDVVASAILFGGKPQAILKASLAGNLRLCIPEPMVTELQGVLQRAKFCFNAQIIQSIISELTLLAEWITPKKHFDLVKEDR
jgi:predicted nucleic acid-binding protein